MPVFLLLFPVRALSLSAGNARLPFLVRLITLISFSAFKTAAAAEQGREASPLFTHERFCPD